MRTKAEIIDQVADESGLDPEYVADCWDEYRQLAAFAASPASKSKSKRKEWAKRVGCSLAELEDAISYVRRMTH